MCSFLAGLQRERKEGRTFSLLLLLLGLVVADQSLSLRHPDERGGEGEKRRGFQTWGTYCPEIAMSSVWRKVTELSSAKSVYTDGPASLLSLLSLPRGEDMAARPPWEELNRGKATTQEICVGQSQCGIATKDHVGLYDVLW